MRNLLRQTTGGTPEHVVVIAAVALAAVSGLCSLGSSMERDIRGAVKTGHPMAMVTSRQAGLGALEDAAEVARGLYATAPEGAKVTMLNHDTYINAVHALTLERIGRGEFLDRLAVPEYTGAVVYDLFQELLRLRDAGALSVSFIDQAELGVDRRRPGASIGDGIVSLIFSSVHLYMFESDLANMEALALPGMPLPRAFINRIRTFAEMNGAGFVDREAWDAAFGHPYRSPEALGALPRVSPFPQSDVPFLEFERTYLDSPALALGKLPVASRQYLELEVLPFLRTTYDGSNGEPVRSLTPTEEAEVVTAIVHGDLRTVEAVLGGVTQSKRLVQDDTIAAATYAAASFAKGEHGAVALKPLSEEEAASLIRLGEGTGATLRARPSGGIVAADLLELLESATFERLTGRPVAHERELLEAMVRAAVQGETAKLRNLEDASRYVVTGVPARVTRALRLAANQFASK